MVSEYCGSVGAVRQGDGKQRGKPKSLPETSPNQRFRKNPAHAELGRGTVQIFFFLACLPFFRCRRVQVADRYGQRIGGVGGFGCLIEVQQSRHHLLDLMLFGSAVSDDGGFDREWRVFGDFQSGGGGGQHRDAAYLAELQCGLYVRGIENVFDGDAVGMMFDDQFMQTDTDARQTGGHRITG